jgi:hypothetical protein
MNMQKEKSEEFRKFDTAVERLLSVSTIQGG